MNHTLHPVEPPYSLEIGEALERYPRTNDGYVIRLFRVFANSLRFLRGKGVLNFLDEDSPLSMKDRELVILRTTANNDCEYEWGIHVAIFAAAAGLSENQIAATRTSGPDADCWSRDDSVLIRAIDELCTCAKIQDRTYGQFRQLWNLEQQLEILALCGNYQTVSYVANTARISLEDMGARFPHESSQTNTSLDDQSTARGPKSN